MYLNVWRPFHHTKLHAYTLSSLIKRNVGGGGPHFGSVTPSLTMALLPLASLWLCYPWPHYGSVTPGLTMALLPLASLWLCYPWPHYGSVTPGLTMALLPLASLWLCYPCMASLWLCYPWSHYSSVTPILTSLPVCVTEILIYCLIEPFPANISERLTTISPYEAL